MRVKVLLQLINDDGTADAAAEVVGFEEVTEHPEDLGLLIAEAKARWRRSSSALHHRRRMLADILPVAAGANATTRREHALHVAERAEAELAEEPPCFIDGCPADWGGLPIPERRIVVGVDGGYVRN